MVYSLEQFIQFQVIQIIFEINREWRGIRDEGMEKGQGNVSFVYRKYRIKFLMSMYLVYVADVEV